MPIIQLIFASGRASWMARTTGSVCVASPRAESLRMHIEGVALKCPRTELLVAMNTRMLNLKKGVIVYDADLVSQAGFEPGEDRFSPEWWERQGRVRGRSEGRGTALIVDTPLGGMVLRQYLRGGWPGKISRASYFFTGFERSRPVREFRILQELSALGLPVPRPLAALCRRQGLLCTGAILLTEIQNVRTLAELIPGAGEETWRRVGGCIRRFHDHGVVHADLNARNILIRQDGKVFLVDFDRARTGQRQGTEASANLKRLRRSLEKFWAPGFGDMDERAWTHLLQGYE